MLTDAGLVADLRRLNVKFLHVDAEGVIDITAGTQSTGQGHATTFAQVAADQLGVPMEAFRLVTGDTSVVRGRFLSLRTEHFRSRVPHSIRINTAHCEIAPAFLMHSARFNSNQGHGQIKFMRGTQ